LIAKYEREHHRNAEAEVLAWVLPELSCRFLTEVAAILPPGSAAFEFGSGRSTHVLRNALPAIASVEHAPDWLDQTEHSTGSVARRPADKTTVIPLERCWNRLRPIESFDLLKHGDTLERLQQAHLILVDSPPNPAKREHALFLALGHAPSDCIIILDDLEIRATARFAARLAKQNARLFRFWILNIDHQLGIFLKIRPGRIRSRPSLTEFVGTWLRA
jgi:hypothetical protein